MEAYRPSVLSNCPPSVFVRVPFAAVWLINGVWCKIMDGVPRHREIVARILGEDHSLMLTRIIGAGEVVMALWILTGIRWKWSCAAQICTVLLMNVIEFFVVPDLLLFGRFNSLVALAYVSLVAWAGFRPVKP
jgi:DoxX-like family